MAVYPISEEPYGAAMEWLRSHIGRAANLLPQTARESVEANLPFMPGAIKKLQMLDPYELRPTLYIGELELESSHDAIAALRQILARAKETGAKDIEFVPLSQNKLTGGHGMEYFAKKVGARPRMKGGNEKDIGMLLAVDKLLEYFGRGK